MLLAPANHRPFAEVVGGMGVGGHFRVKPSARNCEHTVNAHERPRVVILGGGFAGVGAAQKLKKAATDVVVIDRHDYHTFQPLLYQLATGLLDASGVGHSLRDLVHGQDNATIHKATVTAVDISA